MLRLNALLSNRLSTNRLPLKLPISDPLLKLPFPIPFKLPAMKTELRLLDSRITSIKALELASFDAPRMIKCEEWDAAPSWLLFPLWCPITVCLLATDAEETRATKQTARFAVQ